MNETFITVILSGILGATLFATSMLMEDGWGSKVLGAISILLSLPTLGLPLFMSMPLICWMQDVGIKAKFSKTTP